MAEAIASPLPFDSWTGSSSMGNHSGSTATTEDLPASELLMKKGIQFTGTPTNVRTTNVGNNKRQNDKRQKGQT